MAEEWKEEVDVLVRRVVKDINTAFSKNPNIDEIGLIPCPEARYNRSPIVLVENKLGVESWCIKFLLPYVHSKLLLYRQRKQWLNREELIDITCTLLLLNPDFTTAWNARKELIQSGTLNPIKDLHLGKLALSKFPKSPETWIHRRWVLQQLHRDNAFNAVVNKGHACPVPTERTEGIVQEEMQVCSEAAGRYPSNYNAWSHRIWVLQHLAKLHSKILLDELSSTKLWVAMHVSDHSGFHYRQFLIKSLINKAGTERTVSVHNQLANDQPLALVKEDGASSETPRVNLSLLLEEEMELITDLVDSYPGHETLWCHRRHVFYLVHQLETSPSPSSGGPAATGSGDGTLNSPHPTGPTAFPKTQAMDVDVQRYSHRRCYSQEIKRPKRAPAQLSPSSEAELGFIDSMLSTCRNTEQVRFAAAYKKWLVTFIGQ
ncbi:protein prenyltransferase alpha subunit repeat-containing protein 1 [Pleurodeles waltl]|uniref:protein prenyltransferase alpha subunit repeat-containing protein 1 n=1 Tax=Pleurodeles waltl TaxID=8319 RepID=UPI0037099931